MLTIGRAQLQILHRLLAKCWRSHLSCEPATHIKSHYLFLGYKLGMESGASASILAANVAATGRHVKSNFMDRTMNFLFQNPLFDRRWKRMFLSQCSGPTLSTPTLENPIRHQRWPACNLDQFPSAQGWTVCPPGVTCCLWKPQPWASSCGCTGQTWACWPTWNTIQVSFGPLTVHTRTPHFTIGQTCLSIAVAL